MQKKQNNHWPDEFINLILYILQIFDIVSIWFVDFICAMAPAQSVLQAKKIGNWQKRRCVLKRRCGPYSGEESLNQEVSVSPQWNGMWVFCERKELRKVERCSKGWGGWRFGCCFPVTPGARWRFVPSCDPFFNPLRPPVLFSIPGATASCMFENINVFYRVTPTFVTVGLAVSVTNSTFP